MKKYLLKKTVLVLFTAFLLFSCKKDEEEPIPATPSLTREFTLSYTNNQDETQVSFATLDQSQNPFMLNWTDAKNNSQIIHFGFGENAGQPGLFTPGGNSAPMVYADPMVGVATWANKEGVTFENGNAPVVNFDELTVEFIEDNIPDAGFGVNNNSEVLIAQNKIVRFIAEENNVLKYKGFLKVISLKNNPKEAVVRVKYIKK